ncbi:hypothetical protein AAAU27_03515 [Bacteroides ovatus]|uniref:hypothetical protein n=1 Tax=Bacteroides ovatus TaxID=28116 RepID=UPI0032C0217E
MPFACHTAVICIRLSTTKQNICKARQHLKERGLIDFRTGSGIRAPAMYSLTEPYTAQLSPPLTPWLPHELTVQFTHSNIKDKETDKDIISNQHAREESLKSLDELEALLLADIGWQNSVSEMLAKKENGMTDTARIQGYIRDFFSEQRIGGSAQREESDCRSHFYHWINKQLKNNRHGTDRKSRDYRDTDVTARSAKNYEGPF